MMEPEVCSHCKARVLPTKGICPSCRNPFLATVGEEAHNPSQGVPSWRRGWKRRVILWGVACAVMGLVIGGNVGIREAMGRRGLAIELLNLGWFAGAFGRLAIEWQHAHSRIDK